MVLFLFFLVLFFLSFFLSLSFFFLLLLAKEALLDFSVLLPLSVLSRFANAEDQGVLHNIHTHTAL